MWHAHNKSMAISIGGLKIGRKLLFDFSHRYRIATAWFQVVMPRPMAEFFEGKWVTGSSPGPKSAPPTQSFTSGQLSWEQRNAIYDSERIQDLVVGAYYLESGPGL